MEKLAYKQKSGSLVSEEIVNTSNEVFRVGNDEGRVSYACACIVTLIVNRELRGSLLSKWVRKRDLTQEINTFCRSKDTVNIEVWESLISVADEYLSIFMCLDRTNNSHFLCCWSLELQKKANFLGWHSTSWKKAKLDNKGTKKNL